MTGYGREAASLEALAVTVQVSSVNRRALDLAINLPDEWREMEASLAEQVRQVASRGRVSVVVEVEGGGRQAGGVWDEEAAASALDRLQAFAARENVDFAPSADLLWQIANAQRKVEAHNFDIRKNLLDFDDVANDQRKVIYQQRNELLEADDVADTVRAIREDVVEEQVRKFVPRDSIDEQWDLPALERALLEHSNVAIDLQGLHQQTEEIDDAGIALAVQRQVEAQVDAKESQIGPEMARQLEKHLMLNVLDQTWKEHLRDMDDLRSNVQFASHEQKDPLLIYKLESYHLFKNLIAKVNGELTGFLMHARLPQGQQGQVRQAPAPKASEPARLNTQKADSMNLQQRVAVSSQSAPLAQQGIPQGPPPKAEPVKAEVRIGRNDPCPCGSGKKYKACHGQEG